MGVTFDLSDNTTQWPVSRLPKYKVLLHLTFSPYTPTITGWGGGGGYWGEDECVLDTQQEDSLMNPMGNNVLKFRYSRVVD